MQIVFHLGLYEIFVSSLLKQHVINSEHIICLLTLHTLPSGRAAAAVPATKNDYVVLAVHDHRCVMIPRLAEKKYVFELKDDVTIVLNFKRSSWTHYCPMYL